MSERKGGGARRGPFANKRVVFSTRLTQETMDMVARAAERDELSISQKGEQLLIAGLRAEDTFERSVMPLVEVFCEKARRALAANGGRAPDEDAEVARLLRAAANELVAAFPIGLSVDTSAPIEPSSPRVVRTSRLLDLEERTEGED